MPICTKETASCQVTYELVLDYDEVVQLMIDAGFDFLENPCDGNAQPILDVRLLDFDCAISAEHKQGLAPGNKITFLFQSTSEDVTISPETCVICDETATSGPCPIHYALATIRSCASITASAGCL